MVVQTAQVVQALSDAGFRSHRVPDPTGKHRFRRRAGFWCVHDGERVLVWRRTRLGRDTNALKPLHRYQQALVAAGFRAVILRGLRCVEVRSADDS